MSRLLINNLKIASKVQGLPGTMTTMRKPPSYQCVRYYRPRKPFWLPTAKTKLFRIPKKPEIPKEEADELSRLYNVYRTNMKSLRQYFKEQLMAQTTAPEVIEERKQKEANQHAECLKLNEVWNKEVAQLRENRLAKEAIEREENILNKIMEDEAKQNALTAMIDSHIREEKKAAKTFITPENIDEAIEIALTNLVDHNFCIDLEGNIYKGRYGKPPLKPVDQIPKKFTSSNEPEENSPLEARV